MFFKAARVIRKNEADVKYASLSDSTKYVGINTCKQCHADKYETFIQTGMGKSFDLASRNKSSAVFSGHDIIYDKYRDLNYFPHWKNDSLYLTEFRIHSGDTVYKRKENVSWIIGSGQHTNSHMVNVNGYVYQAPFTFYTQKKKWDLPPGFEGGFNSRFSRIIGLECMSCHNAFPDMIEGSENKYSFIANGIDCERCHGPGDVHVNEKRSGKIVNVETEIDYSIVNPAKLPIALQLDICQRCHIQGNAVLEDGKSFYDFRPGMKLSDVMNVYMPLFKNDDDAHIMASHAERMKMSKCFTASVERTEQFNKSHQSLTPYKNAMTCVTCHDPHVSVTQTDHSIVNDKCNSCHTSGSAGSRIINPAVSSSMCIENIEIRKRVNDDCVKCHMPKNETIDIPHVVTTDHWIRVPVKSKQVKDIKEFAGLICINNPSAGNKSKGMAFISYFEKFSSNPAYLDSAKKYFDDTSVKNIIANFSQLVHIAFLKDDFKRVLEYVKSFPGALNSLSKKSYSNEDAWTAYRIGESFYAEGKYVDAVTFFQKSIDLAPYHLDFRNKLAGAQHDAGNTESAKKNYLFILNENPKYASAYINLGYLILTTEKDSNEANRLYDKALELEPDNIQAFFNKAGVMIFEGRKKEAKNFLNEILKRDKNNTKAQQLLRELNNLS